MYRGPGNTWDQELKTLAWHKVDVRERQEISLKMGWDHIQKFFACHFKECGLGSRVMEWTYESHQIGDEHGLNI